MMLKIGFFILLVITTTLAKPIAEENQSNEKEFEHNSLLSKFRKLGEDFEKLAVGIKEDWKNVKRLGLEVFNIWQKDLNDVKTKTIELLQQTKASVKATILSGKDQNAEFNKYSNEMHKMWNDYKSMSEEILNEIKVGLEKIKMKIEDRKKYHSPTENLSLEY